MDGHELAEAITEGGRSRLSAQFCLHVTELTLAIQRAGLAARIGRPARRLAMNRYSWSEAARTLEVFYGRILEKAA